MPSQSGEFGDTLKFKGLIPRFNPTQHLYSICLFVHATLRP